MTSELILKDGTRYEGVSFGANLPAFGEVVFITGMVGYPECFTDPSFKGQILVMTYPLLGNYGVPDKKTWESDRVQISGLVVCNYIDTPSHYTSQQTLAQWLKQQGVPALEIKDTRGLTQKLRTHGVMLGRFVIPAKSRLNSGHEPESKKIDSLRGLADRGNDKEQEFQDPNLRNLVAEVSCKKPYMVENRNPSTSLRAGKTVALIDCGAKFNIARSLAKRGVKVLVVPWQTDVLKLKQKIHGVMISNGPGDPQMAKATIENVRKILAKKLPTFGICLGNQILALAGGGTTYKLKFGHRGQNQPAVLAGTHKAYLTTQNHGFAVGKIPKGFREWFYNGNDKTNEGIIHKSLPFMSVQFHPESYPGPTDTDWLFDEFIKKL